jgi:uroporphyrinogen decarboxylase
MHERADDFARLMNMLVSATAQYLAAQIDAGAQAVQLFESWAGVLQGRDFDRCVVDPHVAITAHLRKLYPHIPIIGFARTANQDDLLRYATVGVQALGLSQDVDIDWAAQNIPPRYCLQGNLDPAALLEGGEKMAAGVARICATFRDRPFVFNLGHGIIKETPPEHVADLIALVRAEEKRRAA